LRVFRGAEFGVLDVRSRPIGLLRHHVFGQAHTQTSVADSVQCAECGHRYDSETNPFCPHCGSTGSRVPPGAAAVAAQAADPMVKRVKRAGIILMVMGSFFVVQAGLVAFLPGMAAESMAPSLANQAGGDLTVIIDPPAIGNLTLRDLDGKVLATTNFTDGRAKLDLGNQAVANATVELAAGNWSRTVVVPESGDLTWRLETDSDSATSDAPLVSPWLLGFMRVTGGIGCAIAGLVVVGGVAAFRRRGRGLALTGAVLGSLLGLLAVMAYLLLGLLFALPLGYAMVAILRGRRVFSTSS
jgi:hypothetical protein